MARLPTYSLAKAGARRIGLGWACSKCSYGAVYAALHGRENRCHPYGTRFNFPLSPSAYALG
jgi:hypothetical protein